MVTVSVTEWRKKEETLLLGNTHLYLIKSEMSWVRVHLLEVFFLLLDCFILGVSNVWIKLTFSCLQTPSTIQSQRCTQTPLY